MKKLIPLVLAAWAVASVGCTTTATTTSTTTTRQPSATTDATIYNTRTTNTANMGPH